MAFLPKLVFERTVVKWDLHPSQSPETNRNCIQKKREWVWGEGRKYMEISKVVEEMDIPFGEEEGGCDGVDGGIAPSFVEEATFVIEVVEECSVTLVPPQMQRRNFEIGPLFIRPC
jgi:hypothetical protein